MNRSYDLKKEKIKMALIYATFGTIGVVTHYIPLSSAAIVFYRALLGVIFIIINSKLTHKTINIKSIINNFPVLVLTGFFMGLNWVLQFEAFRVSTVAIGTVCYNTMPIFLVIIASFVFKEKITAKTFICIIIATIGVVLVSNVINTGIGTNEVLGCVYGILGAIFYALILISNRYLSNISTRDKIIFQFAFSAIIMFIYVKFVTHGSIFFDENIPQKDMIVGIVALILLGLFHTGLCYVHYFDGVSRLKSGTVAILTYIDPVVALLLSYFVLKENMTVMQLIGAIFILGSTLINELTNIKED